MRDRSWPSKRTWPESGFSTPSRQLNSVVLPAPLGPTRPTDSAGSTSMETLSRARMPPKCLQIERASSRAISGAAAWGAGAGFAAGRGLLGLGRPSVGARRCRADHRGCRAGSLGRNPQDVAVEDIGGADEGPVLLVVAHSLGVLGVAQGAQAEQQHREVGPAQAEALEDLLQHHEAERSVGRPLHGAGAGG